MVGYAICEVLNKSFYAIHDGKTPMLASVAGVVFNFAAAFVFVRAINLGLGGLALASASSSIFIALILLVMINKRKRGVISRGFVINSLKALAAAAVCCVAARLVYGFTDSLAGGGFVITLVKLAFSALAALILYVVLGFALRLDETKQIRRFKNGK